MGARWRGGVAGVIKGEDIFVVIETFVEDKVGGGGGHWGECGGERSKWLECSNRR